MHTPDMHGVGPGVEGICYVGEVNIRRSEWPSCPGPKGRNALRFSPYALPHPASASTPAAPSPASNVQARRPDLLHDAHAAPAQEFQHALDARLAEGAEPPRLGAADADGGGAHASALTMSVPRRKPESTSTGMRPFTASMISGSASMVERPESSLRRRGSRR